MCFFYLFVNILLICTDSSEERFYTQRHFLFDGSLMHFFDYKFHFLIIWQHLFVYHFLSNDCNDSSKALCIRTFSFWRIIIAVSGHTVLHPGDLLTDEITKYLNLSALILKMLRMHIFNLKTYQATFICDVCW